MFNKIPSIVPSLPTLNLIGNLVRHTTLTKQVRLGEAMRGLSLGQLSINKSLYNGSLLKWLRGLVANQLGD